VLPIDGETCELKNIATYEQYQGKGYGKALIKFISGFYKNDYKTMLVGTGEVPWIMSFYESCGFEQSYRVKNFFTDNYDHPMFDGEIQLDDMIYLKKELTKTGKDRSKLDIREIRREEYPVLEDFLYHV
jgi:ribosomal protein S18 acetylase RimI-like enzyme